MHNTSIHAQKYMHTNTSMLYKLLFYFPVTISYLVDEIDSPKFLQLICLTFENRFFYFPFFFQFYFIFGVFSLHTLNLLCCIGEQLINNFVIVSGEWRDSAIHIYVSILPQIPLPSRLPHNWTEFHMLCNTSLLLSILNVAVCTWPFQTP